MLQLAFICGMLMISTYIVQIVNYEVVLEFPNEQSWSENIIAKCGKDALDGAYQSHSLSDFGPVAFIFGAFYGLLM